MYKRSDCELVIEKTLMLLKDNKNEWLNRYSEYGKDILKNIDTINNKKSKFNEWEPLYLYMNITNATGHMLFSLRYQGQEVAELKVTDKGVFISTTKYNQNSKYFGFTDVLKNESWSSNQARNFRNFFRQNPARNDSAGKKNNEHRIESLLLTEFSKKAGSDKKLINIQPVKLAGLFRFQMPTPLSASKVSEIEYSGASGGGIDILARVGKGAGVKLCIMELKDTNDKKEPPEKVIQQALAYATFIRELLRSSCGEDWWKIFGFSGTLPGELTLYVASVMPRDGAPLEFAHDTFCIENDRLVLHYIDIDEKDNSINQIKTSLPDKKT